MVFFKRTDDEGGETQGFDEGASFVRGSRVMEDRGARWQRREESMRIGVLPTLNRD